MVEMLPGSQVMCGEKKMKKISILILGCWLAGLVTACTFQIVTPTPAPAAKKANATPTLEIYISTSLPVDPGETGQAQTPKKSPTPEKKDAAETLPTSEPTATATPSLPPPEPTRSETVQVPTAVSTPTPAMPLPEQGVPTAQITILTDQTAVSHTEQSSVPTVVTIITDTLGSGGALVQVTPITQDPTVSNLYDGYGYWYWYGTGGLYQTNSYQYPRNTYTCQRWDAAGRCIAYPGAPTYRNPAPNPNGGGSYCSPADPSCTGYRRPR